MHSSTFSEEANHLSTSHNSRTRDTDQLTVRYRVTVGVAVGSSRLDVDNGSSLGAQAAV